MDSQLKELIRKRSSTLFRLARDYLCEEDASQYEWGEAYKYAWLATRGPKSYLNSFSAGTLDIDVRAVEYIIGSVEPGCFSPRSLLDAETALIAHHNSVVRQYEQQRLHNSPDRHRFVAPAPLLQLPTSR